MKNVVKLLKKVPISSVLFPVIVEDGSLVVDYFIRIMLFLYPLFLVDESIIPGINGKELLYYLLSSLTAFFYICLIIRNHAVYRKRLRPMDLVLIIAVLLLISIAVYRGVYKELPIEKEMFLCCLIGTYFLLRTVNKGYEYYMNLILFLAVFVYAALIQYHLMNTNSFLGIEVMLRQPEVMAPYLILTSAVSSLLFSITRKKGWRIFYIIMTAAGYLLLFLHSDIIAIGIMAVFLLCIPLVFRPVLPLIKDHLILCFLYFFILSNISLLQYTKWFNTDKEFNIQNGIYVELFLALAGILVYSYRKKIPKNREPETIMMKRLQRIYRNMLWAFGMLFLGCLLLNGKLENVPDKFGIKIMKDFCNAWYQALKDNKSFFQTVLEDYAAIGCIFILIFIILSGKHLKKRFGCEERIKKMLLMLSYLFLAELFFYPLQPFSTPLYVVIITFALFMDITKAEETKVNVE